MPADRQSSPCAPEPRVPWWRKAVNPALGAEEPLARYLAMAIPGATVYYLGAAPRLLLNPVGTVRQHVRALPLDAFGPRTLIAFAFPPLLVAVLLASAGGIILTITYGTLRANAIILLLIQIIAAFIAAVASGFILHPTLGRLVTFLGGKSDNVSRTNYFVDAMIALPLFALAVGVTPLVSLVSVPFIGVLPPLLALGAALYLFWISYVWFRAFAVGPGIPSALLILMAASVVGTGFPVIAAVRAELAKAGSRPAAVSAVAPAAGPSELERYQLRRAEIEAAIQKEPSLINKAGVKERFAALISETARVREGPGGDGPGAEEELRAATRHLVDELHAIIFAD